MIRIPTTSINDKNPTSLFFPLTEKLPTQYMKYSTNFTFFCLPKSVYVCLHVCLFVCLYVCSSYTSICSLLSVCCVYRLFYKVRVERKQSVQYFLKIHSLMFFCKVEMVTFLVLIKIDYKPYRNSDGSTFNKNKQLRSKSLNKFFKK